MRIVALLVAALCCFNLIHAQQCDLRVGYFSQTQTLYQAQQQGFFAKTGINICSAAVQGSVEAYQGLVVGRYEVLQSATDNGLSRFYLPSAYPGQNVTLLGQMDGSPLQILATRWEIETIEDLRGKNILVDSPVSGLIFNLRRLLAFHNLYYPRDFQMVESGSQRFQSLRRGWYIAANGVNTSIHAALITAPDSTRVIFNENAYQGEVRNLGVVADDVAPTAGTSLQTDPNHLLNATKASNIHRFMAAILMSRAFVRNPANAATIKQGLMTLQSLTAAEAEVAYARGVTDPVVGEMSADLAFGRLAFGNSAFLKAIFDSRYDNSNYGEAYFNTGFGKLIDYNPRDQGRIIADQLSAVTINNPHSNVCVFPANKGYDYVVENAVARLQAGSTGGCKNLKASFASCTTNDEFAAPVQCTYDAVHDRLTISTSLASHQSSRQYIVKYAVADACAFNQEITQIVTVRTTNSGACVDVRPACSVEVTSTLVNSWASNGASVAQYSVSVANPGITSVTDLTLQVSASDAARLQNVWNFQAVGNNQYTLPSWSSTIAAGGAYTQAGYISTNGPITFSTASVACA